MGTIEFELRVMTAMTFNDIGHIQTVKQAVKNTNCAARRRADGQRGGVIRGILLFIFGLFLLSAIAVGAGGFLAYKEIHRAGPLTEETVILLESGSSVNEIASLLESVGVIRHAELFNAAVRWRKAQGSLKAGEYRFAPGVNVVQVIDILVDGSSILHFVTIPEGRTTAQIMEIIKACLLYTSPSPRDLSTSRMPSSA